MAIAVFGLAQAGPSSAACTNPFATPVGYTTGAGPIAVAVGDFNGDGKLDLAVSNYGGNSVTVLLGDGSGTFPSTKTTPIGTQPGGLAVGDFNHDGKLDLAVTGPGPSGQFGFTGNFVGILLGNGDGTFSFGNSYTVGTGPTSIVAADFNGDGNLDLAVASTTSSTLTVLLGNGFGGFTPQPGLNIPSSDNTNSLAVGDFNGDGKPDLVVTNGSAFRPAVGTVSVLLNTGSGNFTASSVSAVSGIAYAVAVADFNHDGKLDLAVADASNSTPGISVLLGNGNGTFQSPAMLGVSGSSPISLAARDFNGDGNIDLLEANAGSSNFGLGFGDGTGAFPCGVTVSVGTPTATLQSVAVGDFNGDGKPDIALAALRDNSVYVLLANAPTSASCATYQAATNYPVGTFAASPEAIVAGDFNGDGKLDLITGNGNSGDTDLSVLLGNGNGTFQTALNTHSNLPVQSLTAGDFNGDGKLDLAIADFPANGVVVLLGNGDGTFPTFGNVFYSTGPGSEPDFIIAADLNHDNQLDLVVADEGSNSVSVLLGNSNGTFQTPVTYLVGSQPRSVAIGDFNGDGNPDLAVANAAGNSISILLGNGSGGFPTVLTVTGVQGPGSVAAGDFNHDGKLDLAVTNLNANTVSILLGNGFGGFGSPVPYTVPNVNTVTAADVNADGTLDLLVTSSFSINTVSVLVGNGDGTFQAAVPYSVGINPLSLAVGDFNGDGKPDLATANQGSNSVSVLLHSSCQVGNTPAGSSVAVQPVDTTTNASPVTLTFSSVTQAGNTTLTTSASGPPLPSGFGLGSPATYYQLATTATYSGSIQICINYSGVSFYDPSQLSIWHYDSNTNTWTQLATTINTATTTVCASTPSLSPFAVLQPLDTTPPVIIPTVTGTLGSNGWYVSNVSVNWGVSDPESGIASSPGCTPMSLTANTAGTTLTCSATNGAGLQNSVPVTIKIDQSPPNPPTAALSPLPNGAGWNNTSTTVSFMANGDVGPSGVASCTAPTTVSAETAGALETGTCINFAGNTSAATTAVVKIDETAPIVSNVLANPDPVALNTGTTLTATVADSGSVVSGVATAQYTVNGGAPSAMSGTFNQPSVNVSAAVPAFTATGVYNVCVTGADIAGNASTASCIPLPVYDPTGGFATGGGSISSPAGADLANPNASGQATFGFVSKYLPGANTPSGNLEFHFTAGSLNFKSTSMDWLVVTGAPRAQFHGTGTINGGTACQFQVDAWNNSFQPGDLDAFGIRIYACDNGQDRYSVPATPLANGSIIIHKQ